MRAKHGMSPGMIGCTESHYCGKKREDSEREREREREREWRGKNEMKELQMRDFPVRRINQQTMNSTAQSPTPRLRTRASSYTHTDTHTHLSLLPSLCLHARDYCRYIPISLHLHVSSKASKDAKRHIIYLIRDSMKITGNKAGGIKRTAGENVQHCTLCQPSMKSHKKKKKRTPLLFSIGEHGPQNAPVNCE